MSTNPTDYKSESETESTPRPSIVESLKKIREIASENDLERQLLEYIRDESPEIYRKLNKN